eukprot:4459431-Pleurochrysis_carterae.AAC.2
MLRAVATGREGGHLKRVTKLGRLEQSGTGRIAEGTGWDREKERENKAGAEPYLREREMIGRRHSEKGR